MAITIEINSIDKTDQIDWTSFIKTETATKEPDFCEFTIKNYGSKTYQPELNQEVVVYDGSTRVFGGVIIEISEQIIGGLAVGLNITCKDYTELLDRQLVSKTYQNESVNDIIADMLTTFSSGFTDTNVDCPIVIDNIVFNYLTISKCLEKLTEALGNYDWYVDYDKDINFFQSSSIASPFTLSDTSGNYVYNSLEINEETHQIRNEVIVRGGEIQSSTLRTEYFDGDGTKSNWALANKYGQLPVVEVGGVAKTVGLDFLNNDADFQFMWNFNSQSLRATAGNEPPAGTRNLEVTGYPLYPLILVRRDETSIGLYGLHQYLIIDKTIKTIESGIARATAEIIVYGQPSKKGRFRTVSGGLKAGQTISIASSLRSIDDSFFIRNIKTKFRTPTDFIYDVNIEKGGNLNMQDVLSRLLIKNPSDQIDIGSDEVVERFYSFTETVTVEDELSQPTSTTGPYLYGTAVLGFSTIS